MFHLFVYLLCINVTCNILCIILLYIVLGLFHEEFRGTRIVALNPKCYVGVQEDGSLKLSSKGSSKTNQLTCKMYRRILKEQGTKEGINRGFRRRGGHLESYTEGRRALVYLYAKRKVSVDGRTTQPLDV